MIVVSNASPLIGLAGIGQLELLQQLYSTIHIPQAVYHEVVILGTGKTGSDEVALATWITRHTADPTDTTTVMAATGLDVGESEAIALAQSVKANYVVLDDMPGRVYALAQGLQVIGVVGLLLQGKKQGVIPAIKPDLDQLITNGYWINAKLYRAALIQAGETP